MKKNNPQFVLTEDQTNEIRALWDVISEIAKTDRSGFVRLLLARKNAVLTHKQLYLICVNLANLKHAVPEWCHELLYPIHEPV